MSETYVGLGSRLIYCLSTDDVEAINRRRIEPSEIHAGLMTGSWPRGAQAHVGPPVHAGEYYPLDVVVINQSAEKTFVGGKVWLPGSDMLYIINAEEGDEAGKWLTAEAYSQKVKSVLAEQENKESADAPTNLE